MSRTKRIDRLDKNYFINGGYNFFQRDTSSLQIDPTALYVTADRWLIQDLDSFTFEQSEQSTLTPNGKTKNSFKFTINPSVSTKRLRITQRIESIFAQDLVSEIVSGKFQYFTDGAKQVKVIMSTADVEDDFSAITEFYNETFIITDDSTWRELLFEDIAVPSTTHRGVEITFEISDWTTTAGNNIFHIAQAKLNIGKFAQDFSYAGRDYVEEFQLCQRYLYNAVGSHIGVFNNNTVSGGNGAFIVSFDTVMRVSPIMSVTAGTIARFNTIGNLWDGAYTTTTLTQNISKTRINSTLVTATNIGHTAADNEDSSRVDITGGSVLFDAEL